MKRSKALAYALVLVFSLLLGITTSAITAPIAYENKATADSVTIDNKFIDGTTTTGVITLKANTFTSGDTVTIIDSKKLKLGEVKVVSAAEAYTLNVALTRKSGSIGVYVMPATTDFLVSKTITIKYIAQKSPIVAPAKISIVGNADKSDVLTMTGLEIGDAVNVYTATAEDTDKKALVKGIAKGESIDINLGKINLAIATGIKVSITKKDCLESDKLLIKDTALNYTAAPVSTDITNAILIKGGVLVSELSPRDVIKVYSADPTAFLLKYPSAEDTKALNGILLGTKTVGAKDSYVFIPLKTELVDDASVYITKKSPDKTVTLLSDKAQD